MPATDNQNKALENYLLANLSTDDFGRFKSKLKVMSFKLGEALYESGDDPDYVYFPTTAIVSLLSIMENGATTEIGIIGNDGVVGVSLLLGGGTTTNRAIIQSAGEAVRMKSTDLKAEFTRGGRFQALLLRYTQVLMTQISQTAVCNRLHTIEQQLCRWILISHDRLRSDQLIMTQEMISNILGVRREGITHAAQKLAARKLIRKKRGTITIIDRKGLEAAVCECYSVVREESDRLLGRRIAGTFCQSNSKSRGFLTTVAS